MFRRFRQWVAGAEIQAMGKDLDVALDRAQDLAHRVEGLQLRLERLANRVNMRLNRAGARGGDDLQERDAEILEEIRRNQGAAPNGDDWPGWRM